MFGKDEKIDYKDFLDDVEKHQRYLSGDGDQYRLKYDFYTHPNECFMKVPCHEIESGLFKNLNLSKAILEIKLIGVRFENTIFNEANLNNADWDSVLTINNCTFIGTSMHNFQFHCKRLTDCEFDECGFNSANLRLVDFDNSIINNCVFERADIKSANFEHVSGLSGCSFYEANIINTVFPSNYKIISLTLDGQNVVINNGLIYLDFYLGSSMTIDEFMSFDEKYVERDDYDFIMEKVQTNWVKRNKNLIYGVYKEIYYE